MLDNLPLPPALLAALAADPIRSDVTQGVRAAWTHTLATWRR